MDIQGYMPPNSTHKYPEPEQQEASGSSLPALAPPVKEEEYPETSTCCSSQQDVEMEQEEPFIHPSFWANRFDKRKSSPAILGLPFGLNHETPLGVHLSQQRNSIEAAMLLANFNKLLTFPKPTEHEQKGTNKHLYLLSACACVCVLKREEGDESGKSCQKKNKKIKIKILCA
jgi:hypothetical protein